MFSKIIQYADSHKNKIYLSILQCFLSVAFGIIPFFMSYQIIVRVTEFEELDVQYILVRIAVVILSLILQAIYYSKGLNNSHKAAYNILHRIRVSLQGKLEKLPLGYVQGMGVGGLKKMFTDDIEGIEVLLAHAIPEGIANCMIPILVIISMLFVDWRLALLSLAAMPFGIIAFFTMFSIGKSSMEPYYNAGTRMNNTIVEYINGMEVVKVFNQGGEYFGRYRNDILNYRDKTLSWYKSCWPSMSAYKVLIPANAIVMLPVGAYMVINGMVNLSDLILIFCLSSGIGIPLLRLVSFLPALTQLNYKIGNLEKIMDQKPIETGSGSFNGDNYDIKFDNISFAYEDEEVIKDLSLEAKEKEVTALVGESGSGKSTLAKLLVHYYDVLSGSITIGGQDIRNFSLEILGNLISYVSQDNYLFNISLLENIRIGNPKATDKQVLLAAEKAQCMDIIENLPQGYNTIVGGAGNKLSGGEKQRICLARALLKNAPIVVLDEATSFIDSKNEELMNEAIRETVKEKTLIVIAHRLKTISDADKIYVLKDGKIESEGKHEELIEHSEIYKMLWNAGIKSERWNPKGEEYGN
ncbi:MAG: ABC transporter ATP-binding protein/permease [Clostridium sp.]|uniref:ABC transporter ATP-binding protein n=1 Tax=Clostridium sp. TaxID=1506 RepID=UPI0025B93BFE|nr:ABC transporter ATP-binding protein [Clostridium sp.]MCH3964476.1 ABC transporter ATP-binding protein/permease [Clostridium sp.]MCI1714948.1 ABC transporter ATP-binding protein/permease [Clostridium sp.]MCI1799210.1 ABC transporter ATP-binding protein/permease [Clostridium sp.]MCI1813131.1 ABC transporter ATP-binding protein/permease [Clostridium sp.]MCI1870021.1 ABC transporter ATP-binding protein/permease [Clostridium sp.]